MSKGHTNVYIDAELVEHLDIVSEALRIPRSRLIRDVLRPVIERYMDLTPRQVRAHLWPIRRVCARRRGRGSHLLPIACDRCEVVFSPLRADTRYCSRKCMDSAGHDRRREAATTQDRERRQVRRIHEPAFREAERVRSREYRAPQESGELVIAALYVETDGAYYGIEDVDPWDEARDARLYGGPHAVVAHPPCARWCQLAHIIQKRYGYQVGDDGGCFKAALSSVRRFGGVLEHPAFSYAWPAFGLPRPSHSAWTRDLFTTGWVTQVSQCAYGHRARKLTWLYFVGESPPALDWSTPAASKNLHHRPVITAQVSFCANHGDSPLPRLSKREAKASPPAFRDLLLDMARSVS
jgi:hypothetical protein